MPASVFWIAVTGLALALVSLPLGGRDRIWPGVLNGMALGLFALASSLGGGPALLTTALLLTAIGVVALSQGRRAATLYGAAALALGHLCYILVFLALSHAPLWDAFATAPLPAAATIALALSTEIWLTPHAGAGTWPLRAAAALVAALLLAALTLPPVVPGAILLAAAGLVLSLRLTRMPEPAAPTLVIDAGIGILHIAGHALILWAILAA